MKVTLLFGTESGNAELLCEDLGDALAGDHDVAVANLSDSDPATLDHARFHIVVCSTYGAGELPDSAQEFFAKLDAEKPDLTGLRFAIFGLGDRSYGETFANGSQIAMTKLEAAGAARIGPRGLHDASGIVPAEEIALPWALERLKEASA
ncbi:MAG: flavodoxin domain-containing protein [Pseudomonadota bacterium]